MSYTSSKGSNSSGEDGSDQLRRGPWTIEEDNILIQYVSLHGEGRWNLLAKRAGLKRTGKSCRLRWLNYLNPDIKRGNLTPQEQLLILDLHSKWGNRWSRIAQYLPGRTDNEIKNYWRTRVQKQARRLKVDANSTSFQEIVRGYWMPRLLQKVPQRQRSNYTSLLNIQEPTEQYSKSEPSSGIDPGIGPFVGVQAMLEHQDHNSCSNQCTGSRDILQVPQPPEYGKSPSQTYSYSVDNGGDSMNLGSISLLEEIANPDGDSHIGESDWYGSDLGVSLWNIDDMLFQ